MPFQPDSRTAGYLGPNTSPASLFGDAWTDFLHDVVAGVTDLDPTLVRPRWQADPPNEPEAPVDWVAIGITDISSAWQPAVLHKGDGNGIDEMQRDEESSLLCSFYGPNALLNASLLRDGLFIWQNQAALRSVDAGVVEVGELVQAPELFVGQWRNRIDTTVKFRRQVVRQYPVLNLLSAKGTINSDDPNLSVSF